MRKFKPYRIFLLFLVLLYGAQSVQGQIRFVENKGQWEQNILYRAGIPGGYLFVGRNTLTYLFYDKKAIHNFTHEGKAVDVKFHSIKVNFLHCNKIIGTEGEKPESAYYNFFIGNDPSKWAAGVKSYAKVTLKDLYPHIDLEINSDDDGIKFNFLVKPGVIPG